MSFKKFKIIEISQFHYFQKSLINTAQAVCFYISNIQDVLCKIQDVFKRFLKFANFITHEN